MEKYKQTKHSFEKYLEESRKLASKVKLPLVELITCPVCATEAPLTSADDLSHSVDGKTWKGTHWFYRCPGCGEQFTTTESDTLSIASLKPVEQ